MLRARSLAFAALLCVLIAGALPAVSAPTYRNPILYADYSDPDVIRVGDSYYLVASTFHFSPGLPVLRSKDLVHWTIVSHVLPRLDFDTAYDLPGPVDFDDSTAQFPFDAGARTNRYASGVWAPSIREHDGRFYVYFATPSEGIFMASAPAAEGPWSAPVRVIEGAGYEDPCPFWDDDGNAYLVHSRVGAGPLILHRMSPDGKSVLDPGTVIVDEPQQLPVLEGPKLVKRDGYYYIFAPYGGVGEGPQAVLRARKIYGPYEMRTVLSAGTTAVQAPHQGGYVETPSGQGWFVHFNQTGGYGRITHLQPVKWNDGWPIMGELLQGAAQGQPVSSHAAPDVERASPAIFPQTSDEFATPNLGLQWEWNHNPSDTHWSLRERPGYLRLKALPSRSLVAARNTVTQVLQSRASEITTRLLVSGMKDGQKAGLAMFGRQPSWLGVVQTDGARHITFATAGVETAGPVVTSNALVLRMHVEDEQVRFAYSLDEGKTFRDFGTPAAMLFSWWKGARPALFTFNAITADAGAPGGIADFDWLHVRKLDTGDRIDRHALVSRHSPTLTRIDPTSPLMVGNGNLAFTADITGLQTFQEEYSPRVPLMTQAQWAWHSFPNPNGFTLQDSLVDVDVRGVTRRYPWLRDGSETSTPKIAWLRENPHRFSLGRLSLYLPSADGKPVRFADLTNTRQTLDLWTGTLTSRFTVNGAAVQVETRVHPQLDMLVVTLRSPLLAAGRLGVELKFPGVSTQLNPDPANWQHPDRHRTTVVAQGARQLSLERQIDDTRYAVRVESDQDLVVTPTLPHEFRITPGGKSDSLVVMVLFSKEPSRSVLLPPAEVRTAITSHWTEFWRKGAMVELAGSRDLRAPELERRIVLSQYLMALNAAGTVPPQEEGLFSNSWNGKFHLEMHLWHAGHFALWGHTELLERSMPWYLDHLAQAKERARAYGVRGAWWPKMVGPEGRESPSTINPFIMWQQPHPIYLAELIYRSRPTRATLEQYRELVVETANLLASFAHFDRDRGQYVIGPPIIPAQEVFPPLTTLNPTFELEYFRFGLSTAQKWLERSGLPRNPEWDRVLAQLAPLPQKDGLYLATESFPQLWEQDAQQARRDHPSFLAAFGLLPGSGVDRDVMRRTLDATTRQWDLRQTWGWDFPMMAMTAARLHEPQEAIDFLLSDNRNNRFGLAGMTPREHPDGPAWSRDAETYFPSNGALLFAIALMAGGWDGETAAAPGFPPGWTVRSEGLKGLP